MSVSLSDQIRCAKRELAIRQRVYPSWVQQGRMKPYEAEHELAAMQSIMATLEALAKAQGVWMAAEKAAHKLEEFLDGGENPETA